MNSKKAAICIDNGYFSKLCLAMGVPNVDFVKFNWHISQKNGLHESIPFIYDCMPYQSRQPTQEERIRYAKKDKFLSSLRKKGFTIRLGKLQRIAQGSFKQKKVDTLWTADISRLSYTKEIDTVVIVSGDSDFILGVEIAQSVGVRTILWYAQTKSTGTSFDLIKTCDEVHKITLEVLQECKKS